MSIPAPSRASTIEVNQFFSLFFRSPGVDTSINGTSTLNQDCIAGPNNFSGGRVSDFTALGLQVRFFQTLNDVNNPTSQVLHGYRLAYFDADIASSSGGRGNQDLSGTS